jgi:hypothetical protein
MKRRPRICVAKSVVAMLVVGFAAPIGASATSASDWGPGFKGCGSFHAGYKIQVFAKNISCATARRIQKEYWLGPKNRKVEIIPPQGPPVVRLKRFPGWRCFSGTGGGSCTKGSRVAAYSDV